MNDLFTKHLHINNLNNKSSIHPVLKNFKNNPAYREVTKDNETIGVHVIDSGDTDDTPKVYLIPEPPHEFRAGDIVESQEYGKWLCTVINTSLGYSKGFFQPINKDIKWIVNGELLIRPAIVSSKTLYTTGIKDENVIKVPNGMVGIQVALDDATEAIERNMSFIFNKTKYQVTFYDSTTTRGILSLICEEINPSISHRDDMENEIAERYDDEGNDLLGGIPEEPEVPEQPEEISLQIVGKDKIRFGNTSEYIGKGTKQNKIHFTIDNTRVARIIEQGQSYCTIQANNDFESGYFTLKMYLVEDESVFAEKRIEVGF